MSLVVWSRDTFPRFLRGAFIGMFTRLLLTCGGGVCRATATAATTTVCCSRFSASLVCAAATTTVTVCCSRSSVSLVCAAASMSKKKSKEHAEGPPPLLGRIGTSLKCGIVGLPNVG